MAGLYVIRTNTDRAAQIMLRGNIVTGAVGGFASSGQGGVVSRIQAQNFFVLG